MKKKNVWSFLNMYKLKNSNNSRKKMEPNLFLNTLEAKIKLLKFLTRKLWKKLKIGIKMANCVEMTKKLFMRKNMFPILYFMMERNLQ